MTRPTPFDLVFDRIAEASFPGIRVALEAGRIDERDRDAFLMQREVVALVRELRPEEGLGEGIDRLAALLHHAYLYWNAGTHVLDATDSDLPALLGPAPELSRRDFEVAHAYYARFPERRIWAEVLPGQPHEPLDGCFIHTTADDEETLRVLGVFGVHPGRPGFSVVESVGPRTRVLARPDGTPVFASTLPGGPKARLFSLAGEEELLELGWRTRAAGARLWVEASGWKA
jgi:hypothetical protein